MATVLVLYLLLEQRRVFLCSMVLVELSVQAKEFSRVLLLLVRDPQDLDLRLAY
jgi:hypothetical protein